MKRMSNKKQHIEFIDRDSGIEFGTKMKRIQAAFREILKEEKES